MHTTDISYQISDVIYVMLLPCRWNVTMGVDIVSVQLWLGNDWNLILFILISIDFFYLCFYYLLLLYKSCFICHDSYCWGEP